MIELANQPQTLHKDEVDSVLITKYQISAYSSCRPQSLNGENRREEYRYNAACPSGLQVHITTPNYYSDDLKKANERGPILLGSRNSEVYPPSEQKFKLTRQLISQSMTYSQSHALVILTKSDLVLRDIDLLSVLAKRKRLLVIFSLATLDDARAKKVEPSASLPSERLAAINNLRRSGIACGVFLPSPAYLSKGARALDELLSAVKKSGALFALPADASSPEVDHQVCQSFYAALSRHKLMPCVPMSLYHSWFNLYDEMTVLLSHLKILLGNRPERYRKLVAFHNNYAKMLKSIQDKHRAKHRYYQLVSEDIAHWLKTTSSSKDDFDPAIKQYLTPILAGATYQYAAKKWSHQ